MTTHAVVFVDKPPSLTDVFALIFRAIEVMGRKIRIHTAQEKSGDFRDFLGLQFEIGHSQLFERRLYLSSIINSWIFQFVLEESFMFVPPLVFGLVSQ